MSDTLRKKNTLECMFVVVVYTFPVLQGRSQDIMQNGGIKVPFAKKVGKPSLIVDNVKSSPTNHT